MVELFTARPYQTEGASFIVKTARGRGIIGDEQGVGKTGQGYLVYKELGCPSSTLLVAGKNAQYVWRKFGPHWGVEPPVIIEAQVPEIRKMLWQRVKSGELKFVCCTKEVLHRDMKRGWVPWQNFKLVLIDEAHKVANRKTVYWAALKRISFKCNYIVPITGTPLKRGPQSIWGLLSLVRPRRYTSYWGFVERYCHMQQNEMGAQEILCPKNEKLLAQELSTIMIRRLKEDVAPWLPKKTRITDERIELTPEQRRIYYELVQDSIAELSGSNLVIAPTVLAKISRLRQLLICPKILDPNLGDGAALDLLVDKLDDATDTHMVVFTPFTDAFPHVAKRLMDEGYPDVFSLRGGMKVQNIASAIEDWQRTRGIMMCSIQFAESFDLIPATWAYFLGYEWDATANFQAEDRLHRMTVDYKTFYYYPAYSGCIDETLMMPALDEKSNNIGRVYKEVRALLLALKGQTP